MTLILAIWRKNDAKFINLSTLAFLQKLPKKHITFHVASLQQSFLLNSNIQNELHVFTIKKIFTKVEPWYLLV